MLWALLGVVCLLGVVKLIVEMAGDAQRGEGGSPLAPVALVAGIGVVLTLVGVPVARRAARRRAQVLHHVQQVRPGATLVPGSVAGLRYAAERAGVSTHGMGKNPPVILAVVDDLVEVWVGPEPGPRWALERAEIDLKVALIPTGTADRPGIRITSSDNFLLFFPYYPRSHFGRMTMNAMFVRALEGLGEDPAAHLSL